MSKFDATFETYWNNSTFEPYNPDRDRDRLDDALAEASGRKAIDRVTISLSGMEVRPYPYQAEMLEQLEVERVVHERHRNLVVAATGTGKTVIAALDYRALCRSMGGQPVAVVRGAPQGDLGAVPADLPRGARRPHVRRAVRRRLPPERWRHVFASVQSLTAYGVTDIPFDAYEVVVIDEFHHAEARTYRRILEHLEPKELLGLTATPERADGIDVRAFFDGRTAAELRLWDALSADLLCPFHYFAAADGVDLSAIEWKRGAYDVTGFPTSTRGTTAAPRLFSSSFGTRSPTWVPCGLSGSASQLTTPGTWRGHSRRRASRPCR